MGGVAGSILKGAGTWSSGVGAVVVSARMKIGYFVWAGGSVTDKSIKGRGMGLVSV